MHMNRATASEVKPKVERRDAVAMEDLLNVEAVCNRMILRYQLAIDVATLTKKDKVKNLVVDIMVTIPWRVSINY